MTDKPTDDTFELLERSLAGLLEDEQARNDAIAGGEILPPQQRFWLDSILKSKRTSYRGGLLIQLAYAVNGATDLTARQPGARTVAQKLGVFLGSAHIETTKDAFQNIGKNSRSLIRGNFPEWDNSLEWLTDVQLRRDGQILNTAFLYVCAQVAASARPVLPFPQLDRGKLTYAAIMGLIRDLLQTGSGGAYEQYSVAAMLHGLVSQEAASLRVETKHHNASDASTGSAGDIQLYAANRLIEAIEVTANNWNEKLPYASATVKGHDLSRLHIVARVDDWSQSISVLNDSVVEVAALDIRWCLSIMTAVMTRQSRAVAIERLYELLDRKQPRVELVNRLVDALHSHGLTTTHELPHQG